MNEITTLDVPVSQDNARFGIGATTRKWLYAVGTVLFLISLGYVGVFAARNWPLVVGHIHVDPSTLIFATLLYALTHISSSAAWIVGLRRMGQELPFWSALRLNLVAQIGKYLPGNIAHYVARAGLASSLGVRLTHSGIATLLEILATLFAAGAIAIVTLSIDPAPVTAINAALTGYAALPAIVVPGALLVIGAILFRMRVSWRALLMASAWLIVSFVLIGLSFHMLVTAIVPVTFSVAATVGIFAVAWAAGYVVPGAPAGLGVREAILVVWLGPLVGGGAAVACVMLHRILTAIADVAVALVGYFWLRWEKGRS
ncbi:lysylphosphatidylglycerol synthase domain-containing protein [Sphingopyxis sp.]|uniref:lysylphosphatidylglycerol synthase domain-containing protein n=1 Tax=Sphingopyxis sp. TaxID=1908224 RepID=UPI001D1CDBF6|nr:lysylphosphatidylglycerol synthase domain-containing protein [Sphingopyxis sp.]MBW8297008.1 flippase-like domain-containing protein [Sphingopyxis sp.]